MIDNSLDNLIIEKVEDGYAIVGVKDRLLPMPKLVIPNYINHIYGEAFRGCLKLGVVIAHKNLIDINNKAFYCSSLKQITLSKNTFIRRGAFSKCHNLTQAHYHNKIDVEAYMYSGISTLTVDANVKYISGYTFFYCKKLETLYLPDNVIDIGTKTFAHCYGLKSIRFSKNLHTIGIEAFAFCDSLKEINLPSNLKTLLEGCFSSCQELEKVVINEGITNIPKSAFTNCYKLSKVVFPKSLKVINEYAFYNCDNLKNVVVNKNCIIRKDAFPITCKITYI